MSELKDLRAKAEDLRDGLKWRFSGTDARADVNDLDDLLALTFGLLEVCERQDREINRLFKRGCRCAPAD